MGNMVRNNYKDKSNSRFSVFKRDLSQLQQKLDRHNKAAELEKLKTLIKKK